MPTLSGQKFDRSFGAAAAADLRFVRVFFFFAIVFLILPAYLLKR